ncbi:hypothetical protein HFN89_01240 [Rhizobium laguerreae]|nr:hypothetical protein [Rhizobium laguerreae]
MGNLDIRETQIESLPDGLYVLGNVLAKGTLLSRIGAGITVTKDLMIQDTSVAAIPDDIEIRGSLIARSTKLEAIPDNLSVGMNVDFGKTPIRSLPKGFRVLGSLSIDDCPNMTDLPEHLQVAGTLNIEKTPISRIPEGAKIGRGLRAAGSSIVDLGIGGDFQFDDTPLRHRQELKEAAQPSTAASVRFAR